MSYDGRLWRNADRSSADTARNDEGGNTFDRQRLSVKGGHRMVALSGRAGL